MRKKRKFEGFFFSIVFVLTSFLIWYLIPLGWITAASSRRGSAEMTSFVFYCIVRVLYHIWIMIGVVGNVVTWLNI
jgi:hypothetical protein